MRKKDNGKKQSLKNKKVLIVIAIILIIIVVTCIAISTNKDKTPMQKTETKNSYVKETEDGIKVNVSNKLNEAKLVNGLLISNIQLTEKDGITTLLADVKNKSEQKTDFRKLKIIFLDETGNELSSMTAFVNGLEPGESTQLNSSTTSNYIKAYDFKIVTE